MLLIFFLLGKRNVQRGQKVSCWNLDRLYLLDYTRYARFPHDWCIFRSVRLDLWLNRFRFNMRLTNDGFGIRFRLRLCGKCRLVKGWLPFTVPVIGEVIWRRRHVAPVITHVPKGRSWFGVYVSSGLF